MLENNRRRRLPQVKYTNEQNQRRTKLWSTPGGGGGGGTAMYGLYRYVPLWRVWFSSSLLQDRVYKSERLGLE